jgi:hypothetical protein
MAADAKALNGEQQVGRRDATADSRDGVEQERCADGADEGGRGNRPIAKAHRTTEAQHQDGAERGAAGDAEHEGIRQRIAQQRLEEHPGDRQRGADQNPQHDAGQPDPQHDVGGRAGRVCAAQHGSHVAGRQCTRPRDQTDEGRRQQYQQHRQEHDRDAARRQHGHGASSFEVRSVSLASGSLRAGFASLSSRSSLASSSLRAGFAGLR